MGSADVCFRTPREILPKSCHFSVRRRLPLPNRTLLEVRHVDNSKKVVRFLLGTYLRRGPEHRYPGESNFASRPSTLFYWHRSCPSKNVGVEPASALMSTGWSSTESRQSGTRKVCRFTKGAKRELGEQKDGKTKSSIRAQYSLFYLFVFPKQNMMLERSRVTRSEFAFLRDVDDPLTTT